MTQTSRFDFIAEFRAAVRAKRPDFRALGVITASDELYPIGTDTKVLSTIFELIVRPYVYEIASRHELAVVETTVQNAYPDFTLMKNPDDPQKIAVDVKTTYRRYRTGGKWVASFTLGGYTSFLRNETKNIAFPYSSYGRHYIIGFIYDRVAIPATAHRYWLDEREKVSSPITNIEYFVQEKYRIAGESPGSGNTTNIGSIAGTSIADFADGSGPFAAAGEEVFHDYWQNYGRTAAERQYRNLAEYREWARRRRR